MPCGLVPALKTLNTDLVSIVKGAGLKPRMQSGLVTAQVTLSTALLIAAAVLGHSVLGNVSRPRSFASDGVVMTTMALPDSKYTPERRFALLRRLLDTVEHAAGVSATSIVLNVPVANNAATTSVEARANGHVARAQVNVATGGLFRTLSVPMLAGRDFLPSDDANPAEVAIVNESLARAFWADRNPVGETLLLGNGTSVRVIGLARHRNGARDAPCIADTVSAARVRAADDTDRVVQDPGECDRTHAAGEVAPVAARSGRRGLQRDVAR
jgi:hypothetical protein